jgi:hypothetical protein
MGAGFIVIAVLPATLGLMVAALTQSWAPFLSGIIVGMIAPIVVFLWLWVRAMGNRAPALSMIHHKKVA